MIYIVSVESLEDYNEKHNTNKDFEQLTDEEFIKLAGNWKFNDWNRFMEEFNNDGDFAPYPYEHYIREIK